MQFLAILKYISKTYRSLKGRLAAIGFRHPKTLIVGGSFSLLKYISKTYRSLKGRLAAIGFRDPKTLIVGGSLSLLKYISKTYRSLKGRLGTIDFRDPKTLIVGGSLSLLTLIFIIWLLIPAPTKETKQSTDILSNNLELLSRLLSLPAGKAQGYPQKKNISFPRKK